MSAEEKRTAQDIEADLARTRAELATSVDELSTMIDPRVQMRETKERLKAAVGRGKSAVRDATSHDGEAAGPSFLDNVKNGDPKAIGILGGAVATIAVATAILARRSR